MKTQVPVLRPKPDALSILDELQETLAERIHAPIVAAGYDAAPPILTSRLAPLELQHTDRRTTLTAAAYHHDLVIQHDRGQIRAPKSELRKLNAYDKHGIDPDEIVVIRELPGLWHPGDVPPRMIGLETVETARSQHVQHLQAAATALALGRVLLRTAGAAIGTATGAVVVLGAITVAGVAGAISAPLEGGLDPIILAGIRHPRTGAIAWTAISAWDEIEDDRGW
jgi:hypothetical protein